MDIEFNVNQQTLTRADKKGTANKSQEYLQCSFSFSEEWDSLTKFAMFTTPDGLNYRESISNGACLVPNAVQGDDYFKLGVYGVDGDVRATTNVVKVRLMGSNYSTHVEDDLPDDDPTVVEQIYEAIGEKADAVHTHTKADITDLGTVLSSDDIVDDLDTRESTKVLSAKQGNRLKGMVDDKADAIHTHSKSDITDFSHTHTKNQITDFSHNHDERYYTESEVDAIINGLLNRCNLTSDKAIIQTGDTADLTARLLSDGMPVNNTTIYFYKKEETQ